MGDPDTPGWFAAASEIELSLLGSVELRRDGSSVAIRSRKGRAILAYLALSPGGVEHRERLSGLLWSDTAEMKARASLRQVLHSLASDLVSADVLILSLSRNSVIFDVARAGTDLGLLEEDLRYGTIGRKLRGVVSLSRTLCADLEGLDPAFDVWLNVQREMLHRRLTDRLELLMGAGPSSRPAAQALLALDPTHEGASRTLMRAYVQGGDVAAALRVYKDLWDLLERDYDSEPSPETRDLVVAIKTERLVGGGQVSVPVGPPVAAFPGAEADPLTFINVSPFDGAGVDPELCYAVDGLRHEIVASLVRFREWAIVDGSAGDLVAGESVGPGRRFSLDGTVRQSGAKLFVTLTVKQRPAGRYMWSEVFEFAPANWLEMRASLVGRIAVALNVRLATRLSGDASRDDVAPATYELWLRGHQLLSSWRIADRQRASQLLGRVLADAPGFAPAHASIVRLHNSEHIVRPGVRRDPVRAAEALRHARVGLSLDPLNSRAHLGLAWSLAMSGRHADAEGAFHAAVELNGNDTWTIASAAQGLSFCGEHVDAVGLADRVLAIDGKPTRPCWGYQVGVRYLAGDYGRAVEAARRAGDVISNLPAWHAAALAKLGRAEEASAELSRFLSTISAAWQSERRATDAEIVDWLLHSFPFRLKRDWDHLRDGVEVARASPARPSGQ